MTKVNYKRATITRTRSLNKFDSYPRRAQEPWVSPKGVISALLSLFRQVYILCFLIQQENHELLGKKILIYQEDLIGRKVLLYHRHQRQRQTTIIGTRKSPNLFLKEKWRHGRILHPNNYFSCIVFRY
jgi:hypothetical protein